MDRRTFLTAMPAMLASGCVSVGGVAGPPAPAPVLRVGDRWIYNCTDGFRLPVVWVEAHEVTRIDAAGITMTVTARGDLNFERTETLSSPGVVVSGAVFNPDETRNFQPPMTRFDFPLTPNTQWSQRLRNFNPVNQLTDQVDRFVRVGGYETVTVPAGTFNALTMRTIMSVDENNPFRFPFQCNYLTWWSPEAGATVRETKFATYRERGDTRDAFEIRAQNTDIQLASYTRAKG
jgi:hypothetical protein